MFAARDLVIVAVLGLEIVLFGIVDLLHPNQPHFVSFDSIALAARFVAFIGLGSVGACVVIISGGIDLSVGALFGLCGIVFALALSAANGWLALALAIGVGIGFGLINGFCIAHLRIPPFIVTLGTMSIARGLAFLITGGVQVPRPEQPFTPGGEHLLALLDKHFLASANFAGVNLGLIVMLAAAVITALMLVETPWGRRIHALGGNEQAARYSGVRVNRMKLSAYTLAGFFAGLSGIFYLARWKGINSGVTQQGLELDIIAAAVVGGVSLQGGKGSPIGAVIGALIIKILNDGLTFYAVPQAVSLIAKGALIILAVSLDQALKLARRAD